MKNRFNLLGICLSFFIINPIIWCSPAEGAKVGSSDLVIEVKNGLLTASVKKVPLITILEKLAEQTGIGFEIYADTERKITANYSNIALEEGLRRLLSPSNHMIIYKGKNSPTKKVKIHKIIVLDKSGGSSGQGVKRQPAELSGGKDDERTNPISIVESEKMDSEIPLEDLAKQLNDADPDVREEAVTDMAEVYKERALIYLEKALLHDGNDVVRSAAAEEIGDLENVRGIDILAKGLNDPDEEVRETVVDALGDIGGKNALPALRQALKDKNEDIRDAAAELIEEIEEEEKGE